MNEVEMYISGLSIPDVSSKTGIPLSSLRTILLKAGVLRSRLEGIRLAAVSGKLGSGKRGKKCPLTPAWKENIRKARIKHGEIHAAGVSLRQNGYYEITRGINKGRSVHVVVMEERLGRRIKRGECVHHINGIKTDNRIDNLELMTLSKHMSHHASENLINRIRNKKGQFI